jgi:hypothetical protein
LKRSLHIVHDFGDIPAKAPSIVSIGGQLVTVVDTGDGVARDRFVDVLVEAGAARVDSGSNTTPELRIVIRRTPASPEGRRRAEVLEAAADVVLGSARPSFARHLGLACARWVNS